MKMNARKCGGEAGRDGGGGGSVCRLYSMKSTTKVHSRIPEGHTTASSRWHLLVLVGEACFCREKKSVWLIRGRNKLLGTKGNTRVWQPPYCARIFYTPLRVEAKPGNAWHFPTNASCQKVAQWDTKSMRMPFFSTLNCLLQCDFVIHWLVTGRKTTLPITQRVQLEVTKGSGCYLLLWPVDGTTTDLSIRLSCWFEWLPSVFACEKGDKTFLG